MAGGSFKSFASGPIFVENESTRRQSARKYVRSFVSVWDVTVGLNNNKTSLSKRTSHKLQRERVIYCPPRAVSVNLSIKPSNMGSGTMTESSFSRKVPRGSVGALESVWPAVSRNARSVDA